MDEEKKSESSWEQVGPYQLREQVPQDAYNRGELYRAMHESSGATALVLRPAEDGKSPVHLTDWQVRFSSSAAPSYVALEVEHTPRTVAQDRQSMESLVCTFEDVREAVGHMDQALHAPTPSRPWWLLGLALAGAAAVLVMALRPATVAPVAEMPVHEEAAEDVWTTDVNVDPVPVRSSEAPQPRKNQKRAPCTEGLEVEVSGACWLPIEKRPCPKQTVAYQGQCLLAVAVPRPPVTSLDGGDGSEPR